MPIDPNKLSAFAKKQSASPAAAMLKKKAAAQSRPVTATPQGGFLPKSKPAAPKAPQGPQGPGKEMDLRALVEQAAQAAEAASDPSMEEMLPEVYKTQDGAPPAWATDTDLWQQAMDAVGIGAIDEDRYDEPLAVVAYLYKSMGGTVGGSAAPDGQNPPEGVAPAEEGGVSKADVRGAAGKLAAAKAGKPPPGAQPAVPGAKPPAPVAASPQPPPGAPPRPGAVPPPGQAEAGGAVTPEMVEQAAQMATSAPDPDLVAKLQQEPVQEGAAPSWADPTLWASAEAAVRPRWAEFPDPFIVVAHVYKGMGGTVNVAVTAAAAAAPDAAAPATATGMLG